MSVRARAALWFAVAGCGPSPADTTAGSSGETTSATSPDAPTTTSPDTPTTASCIGECCETREISGSFDVWPDDPALFRCVSVIHGDLTFVSGGFIQDQFAHLRRVTGTLTPLGYYGNFEFLSALESVGSLVIDGPLADGEITGLNRLHTIETMLKLKGASELVSLGSLGKVAHGPSHLEIYDAPLLEAIDLKLASHVDVVRLELLPRLADLSLFEQVDTVGTLVLRDLPGVPTLAGLGHFNSFERLEIGGCPGQGSRGLDALTDLGGLDALTDVGVLSITGNDALVSLAGAPQLTAIDVVIIEDNELLPQPEIDALLAQNSHPDPQVCVEPIVCNCP